MNPAVSTPKFSIEADDAARVIEMRMSGKLTRADYDELLPQLEKLLGSWPKVNFLLVLHDFHGWEAGAAWAELKFDIRNWKRFGRIAVVGESAQERWGTWLSGLLAPEPVRFFVPADEAVAHAWVRKRPVEKT